MAWSLELPADLDPAATRITFVVVRHQHHLATAHGADGAHFFDWPIRAVPVERHRFGAILVVAFVFPLTVIIVIHHGYNIQGLWVWVNKIPENNRNSCGHKKAPRKELSAVAEGDLLDLVLDHKPTATRGGFHSSDFNHDPLFDQFLEAQV